jgi:hypothetical protein
MTLASENVLVTVRKMQRRKLLIAMPTVFCPVVWLLRRPPGSRSLLPSVDFSGEGVQSRLGEAWLNSQ